MTTIDFSNDTHRRRNILTGEWTLVSPHRSKRPWQGKQEDQASDQRPSYDPSCYLCPGNVRAGGMSNPSYEGTYVFTNDFAALQQTNNEATFEQGLLHAKGEQGVCRVVCFSPDHAKTIADLTILELEQVISCWQSEYESLGALDYVNYVQVFENKGAVMGCSNPHPHGQIWAQSTIPGEAAKKDREQRLYWQGQEQSLLQNYVQQELEVNQRIVHASEHFVTLVPFWAVWPYEAMIVPRRHCQNIIQLSTEERQDFAACLQDLTRRYDRVFETSFPYSSGIHQQPTDGLKRPWWHWHMVFYPPLLRSATVKKFMVGYEMLGDPQRDITAEMAAERLSELG